jgi:hypothetical protein
VSGSSPSLLGQDRGQNAGRAVLGYKSTTRGNPRATRCMAGSVRDTVPESSGDAEDASDIADRGVLVPGGYSLEVCPLDPWVFFGTGVAWHVPIMIVWSRITRMAA